MISKTTFQLGKYLGLLVLLFPNFLYSSGIILTEENLAEVLNELNYLHAEEIVIPMEEIKNFLETNNSGELDHSLPLTEGMTEFHDENNIILSWADVPGIKKHEVRYLNLSTGNFGSSTTSNNSINFELPDDLFLFTFQSRSDQKKGPSWIIIEDKPLAFASNVGNCRCDAPIFHPTKSIIPYGDLLYAIQPGDYEQFIVIHSKYAAGNSGLLFADFVVRLGVNMDGLYDVDLVQSQPGGDICLQNSDTDFSFIYNLSPFVNSSPWEDRVIKFVFNPEGIYFRGLHPDVSGIVFVSECTTPPKQLEQLSTEMRSPQTMRPYPNPTAGHFTFDIDPSTEATAEILINNSVGQQLKRITTTKKQSKTSVDISDFPNGTYYLEIIQAAKREIFPIVKME